MKRETSKKVFILLVVVLLVSIAGFCYTEYGNNRIKYNLRVAAAKIIQVELVDKYNRQCIEFELDGDTFRKNREDLEYRFLIALKGAQVPIAFDSTDHNYNQLLLSPDDYRKYGITYVDSLSLKK